MLEILPLSEHDLDEQQEQPSVVEHVDGLLPEEADEADAEELEAEHDGSAEFEFYAKAITPLVAVLGEVL